MGIPRSILLFGPPKRGKSTCAASIVDVPGYERVLVVDVEGGAAAISQWYPEVDVFEVHTAEEFDGVVEALVNNQIVEPTSGKPYDCVIIDTLDKAQERKLEWFDQQPEALTRAERRILSTSGAQLKLGLLSLQMPCTWHPSSLSSWLTSWMRGIS